LALGFINIFIRPVVSLLALPFTIVTFGLFALVVNALMLWLVSAIVPGFVVTGFVAALIGSILLGIISGVLHWLLRAV
ncbi:MAG: phage holin family protein, partial [Firmicutes bacterium]|nr:phage holin family protein [Bacillota bacterium]